MPKFQDNTTGTPADASIVPGVQDLAGTPLDLKYTFAAIWEYIRLKMVSMGELFADLLQVGGSDGHTLHGDGSAELAGGRIVIAGDGGMYASTIAVKVNSDPATITLSGAGTVTAVAFVGDGSALTGIGGGGSQSPWTGNINAANHDLSAVGDITNDNMSLQAIGIASFDQGSVVLGNASGGGSAVFANGATTIATDGSASFASGKVLLSADGHLTLIPSPRTVQVGGTLKVNTTTTGNIGAGEDDLIAYPIPANTLANDGEYLEFDCWGSFAATATLKQLRIYCGGSFQIFDTTSLIFNGKAWRAHGKIVRTSSADATITIEFTVGGTLLSAVNGTICTTFAYEGDWTDDLNFKVTGQDNGVTPADNAVVQNAMVLKWYPAQ